RCQVCGACTEKCYAEALEMIGREMTVDEVITEVLKDMPFYETSGGGMTLSGGEPLLQIDFSEALLRRARAEGLHCCMETCGYAPYKHIARVVPFVDLFLYDVKETDPERHRRYTGVSCDRIKKNLQRLHDAGAPILVRLPIVPGVNDTAEHFAGIARLAARLPRVQGYEIMPYHRLGEGKLDRLGLDAADRIQTTTPSKTAVAGWIDRLTELGVPVINERTVETV
ncbi:MAG: glycyl-radical enzyme activating protein, partial [Lentisphaeria bacterium]|nr:glycyl-radical enzyme activating protein [Lentisphaeria bacterium]